MVSPKTPSRILVLAANPRHTNILSLNEEMGRIKTALEESGNRNEFQFVPQMAVRADELQKYFIECSPQIVHFSGHGDGINGLVLEDKLGNEQLVSTKALEELFSLFKDTIKCVFLNACYSEIQAKALHSCIPFVIGINQHIDDQVAIEFAHAFYRAIGNNESFEAAYKFGRNQLNLLNRPDVTTYFKRPQQEDTKIPAKQNPYKGLYAFSEEDTAFFFGREEFTQKLSEMAHRQQLVPVIGTSGSGKSSVVFAGLIPLLKQEMVWLVESFRPQTQPFDQLALALVSQLEPELDGVEKANKVGSLASSLKEGKVVKLHQVASQILEKRHDKRFLLVVDQFEELYTRCKDREEQQNFIKALLAAVERECITLVFTLRADFYDYALSYPCFCEALQKFNHIPLGLMSRAELQAAIEQPAQKLNVRFQPHLVEKILDDIGNEPGSLPLLEFALTKLWDERIQRQDEELTHEAYEDIGGVQQALIKHAENIFLKLSESQQQQARQVFLKLVQYNEATENTRRVTTKNNIGQQNWELVTYLAGSEARLLVAGRNDQFGEETVEVAHEVLIQKWKRLREWLEQDREFLTWLQELRLVKQQWQRHNRDEALLLRGKALADAQEWLQERPDDLTVEQKYIQRSLLLREEELERQKQEREKRQRNKRLFWAFTTVVLLFGWGYTGIQKQEAQKNEIDALTATSEKLLIANQNFDALIYGLEAGQKLRQIGLADKKLEQQVKTVLQQAVVSFKELNRLEEHSNWVYSVSFSPFNNNIVSASLDETAKIWQPNGTLDKTLEHKGKVLDVSLCEDGSFATASEDKTVKIWTQYGTLYQSLPHDSSVLKVSFAPDCKTLVTASKTQVLLWNVEQEKPKPKLLEQNSTVNSVSFSPNGNTIAIANDDHIIRLLNLNGEEQEILKGHKDKISDIKFSPLNENAQTIATASWDKTAKIWSQKNGKWVATTLEHADRVFGVSFSPDGQTIATASWDKTVKIWDLDGTLRGTIKHGDRVNSVSFSKDNIIASGGADNTVKLWKIDYRLQPIYAHDRSVRSVSFNPKDNIIATASEDGTTKIWKEKENGYYLHKDLKNPDNKESYVNGVSFSPDGEVIATAYADGKTHLWDIDGKHIRTLKDPNLKGDKTHDGEVFFAVYSSGGDMIATASADKTAKLWNLDGMYIKTLGGDQGHTDRVTDVSFSPGGDMIATASDDGTAKIWRTSDGKLCVTLKGHADEVNGIDFNSDGTTIATASDDYTVKLWKLDDTLCQTPDPNRTLNAYKTLKGHEERIIDVKFSPDGQLIASASFDKTVRLWDIDGKLLRTFQKHNDWVWSVDFSSDGKTLVSGSYDTTIRFWNVEEKETQDLNLDDWLKKGCSQVENYLKNSNQVDESTKQICKYSKRQEF